MFKMNKMIMIAVVAMAFVAVAGVANATYVPVTVTVDTIQTNGNYIGVPTQIAGELYHYGYNYTFNPDGTYAIYGTVTNSNNLTGYNVWVYANGAETEVYVPKAVDHYYAVGPLTSDKAYGFTTDSSVGFSMTVAAPSSDIAVQYNIIDHANPKMDADMGDTDYINEGEGLHTVDQGPMSNMVVVYTNGKIETNSSLDFGLNETSSDLNAYFSNGKFDFKNSPLYSFL